MFSVFYNKKLKNVWHLAASDCFIDPNMDRKRKTNHFYASGNYEYLKTKLHAISASAFSCGIFAFSE